MDADAKSSSHLGTAVDHGLAQSGRRGLNGIDADLVNSYLRLQVESLSIQLQAAKKQVQDSQAQTADDNDLHELWQRSAPARTSMGVVLIVSALIALMTWPDLRIGLDGTEKFVTDIGDGIKKVLESWFGKTNVKGLLDDMSTVINTITALGGGGLLLLGRKIAYRSRATGLLIVLASLLAASLISILVIAEADPHVHLFVSRDIHPLKMWGWLVLVLVSGVGLGLVVELGDLAMSGPAKAFASGSPLVERLGRVTTRISSTRPGNLLARVGGAAGQPAAGRLRMALFSLVPIASLAGTIAGTWSDPSSNVVLLLLPSLPAWLIWAVWASIAIPSQLRVTYLPLLAGMIAVGFLVHGNMAFLALATIISAGVPISIWRARPGR